MVEKKDKKEGKGVGERRTYRSPIRDFVFEHVLDGDLRDQEKAGYEQIRKRMTHIKNVTTRC